MDNSLLVSLSQQLAAYPFDGRDREQSRQCLHAWLQARNRASSRNMSTQVRPAEGQKGTQIAQLREGCRQSARSVAGRTHAYRRAAGCRHQRQRLFRGADARGHALHPRRPFLAGRQRPAGHSRRLSRAGRWRRHHHHARRRRHQYRHRRHHLQHHQRHHQPARQAAGGGFRQRQRSDQAGRQPLLHHARRPTPATASDAAGHAGKLQRPAGDRDQPHDRGDAGLSGDRHA